MLVVGWILACVALGLGRYLLARRGGPTYWEKRLRGPQTATVTRPFAAGDDPAYAWGAVRLHGELWSARCPLGLAETLTVGERVVVVPGEGLVLTVTDRWRRPPRAGRNGSR